MRWQSILATKACSKYGRLESGGDDGSLGRPSTGARPRYGHLAMLLAAALALASPVRSEDLSARSARFRSELRTALDEQDRWLGQGANAQAWRLWLENGALRDQLDGDAPLDVIRLDDALERYRGGHRGLENPRFVRVRKALEHWLDVLPEPGPLELASAARAAADGTAQSPSALDATRGDLAAALAGLAQHLGRDRRHGAGWSRYLACSELEQLLRQPENPDLERLEAIALRYGSGHLGLEQPEMKRLGRALDGYCCQLRVAALVDPAADVRVCLKSLAVNLEKDAQKRRGRQLDEIARALDWLERHDQAPSVVRAVRRQFARPNLWAQVAGRAVLEPLARSVDERIAIRESAGGAFITGSGRLRGRVTFHFAPSDDRAAIRMRFDGKLHTRITGHSGPVGFGAQGQTSVTGTKWLLADVDGARALPAEARAETQLIVTGVWSSFRGPILNRIATRAGSREIMARRPSSQQRASRKAEADLERRFDAEARAIVAELNQTYADGLRVPLHEKGIFPRHLRMSTTAEHLQLAVTQAGRGQLAAFTDPPALDDRAAAAVAMHESLINNSTCILLAGRTLHSAELAEMLRSLLGSVPPEFDNVQGVPWELTLAETGPLEVRFSEGTMRTTIRGSRIAAGPEQYNVPFVISAVYRPSLDGGAIVLARQGELEIAGPSLDGLAKLDGEMTEAQAEVKARFEMIFREELRLSADRLPLALPGGSELLPRSIEISDGWMLASFDATAAPTALAAAGTR